MSFHWFSQKNQTFRPQKSHFNSRPHFQELQDKKLSTLGLGNFQDAVQLPEGEDLNEWLAVNVVDFYNQLNMLYATITEFCTPKTCPTMSAGDGFKYLWSDGQQYKKPTQVPACEYVSLLMNWIESLLDDETIFPSQIDHPFPKNFQQVIKNIMKRLFRIYAHCYYHHMDNFEQLGALAHLNTSFKQFIFFNNEFNLIPTEQLEPLKEIINQILPPKKK